MDIESLSKKYLSILKNKIYKILPLIEEENEFVDKHVKTIIDELFGFLWFHKSLEKDVNFISLMIMMHSIYDDTFFEDYEHQDIRRKVFHCLNLIDKIIKGVEEDEDERKPD